MSKCFYLHVFPSPSFHIPARQHYSRVYSHLIYYILLYWKSTVPHFHVNQMVDFPQSTFRLLSPPTISCIPNTGLFVTTGFHTPSNEPFAGPLQITKRQRLHTHKEKEKKSMAVIRTRNHSTWWDPTQTLLFFLQLQQIVLSTTNPWFLSPLPSPLTCD